MKKRPHLKLTSLGKISSRRKGFTITKPHYYLRDILNDKECDFEGFFKIKPFPDSKKMIKKSYDDENLVNAVIDSSNWIKKYCKDDSLFYVNEYAEKVSEDLQIIKESKLELQEKLYEVQESHLDLKNLLIKVLQEEDIDLSKYSNFFTEKDREMMVRKRKIDSVLDDNSDEDN
jgi:hypothetical protein